MKSALVLFAHGARDPEWAAPFRALQAKVAAKRPELTVALAFLEMMQPSLADCVARLAGEGHRRITIAPLFLAQGGHLKRDLPPLLDDLRARHRDTTIALLPAIGDVEDLLDAMAAWLADGTPR